MPGFFFCKDSNRSLPERQEKEGLKRRPKGGVHEPNESGANNPPLSAFARQSPTSGGRRRASQKDYLVLLYSIDVISASFGR